MLRTKAISFYRPGIALAVFIGVLCTHGGGAHADGISMPAAPSAPVTLTQFESFIQSNCVPCVREFYPITTVPVPSVKMPAYTGLVRVNPAATTREGELRFELLRAYPVDLENRQSFAMRVAVWVSAGSDGSMQPLGAGLLDEDEIPVLVAALAQISKAKRPAADDSSIMLVDTEFHADAVRMGTVRTGSDVVAYVQVAPTEVPRFALKPVWEVPTMYLPLKDIPALEAAATQVNAKIRAIRGR